VSWDWDYALECLPRLLEGFRITLLATVLGTVVAAALGRVLAIVRRAAPRGVALPVRAASEFVRSTPLLVQLLMVYFLVPQRSPLTLGVLVLGVHYATYMAEGYRAGIDGVPAGQWEACRALSLPPVRTWRAVILPQAVRNVLPALGNYVISMFKETPFLAAITVGVMMFEAQRFGSNHFRYIEPFTLAGLFFLAASYPTSVLLRKLEIRLGH
jgi:polar amino acid transport system permease protein